MAQQWKTLAAQACRDRRARAAAGGDQLQKRCMQLKGEGMTKQ